MTCLVKFSVFYLVLPVQYGSCGLMSAIYLFFWEHLSNLLVSHPQFTNSGGQLLVPSHNRNMSMYALSSLLIATAVA